MTDIIVLPIASISDINENIPIAEAYPVYETVNENEIFDKIVNKIVDKTDKKQKIKIVIKKKPVVVEKKTSVIKKTENDNDNDNDNDNENIKQVPMLVGVFNEKIFKKEPKWIIQEKFDGWRSYYKNGKFYTKHGLDLPVSQHITDYINTYKATWGLYVCLDGEMFNGYTMKSTNNVDEDEKYQQYIIFDAPHIDAPYKERLEWLYKNCPNTKYVKVVDSLEIDNTHQTDTQTHTEKIKSYYDNVLARGGEGIVYKTPDMVYKWNTRNNMTMKLKPWDTDKVTIIDYFNTKKRNEKNENEKKSNYVSSYIVRKEGSIPSETVTFKVQCKTLTPFPIGTEINIKYCQLTVNNLPKFPQIIKGQEPEPEPEPEPELELKESKTTTDKPKRKYVKKPKNTETTETTENKPEPKTDITELSYLTMTEYQWIRRGGYVMQRGEKVGVIGSKGDVYNVIKAKRDDSIYCSCPAWKYQKKHPGFRTCKHCIAVCGEEQEEARCKLN